MLAGQLCSAGNEEALGSRPFTITDRYYVIAHQISRPMISRCFRLFLTRNARHLKR